MYAISWSVDLQSKIGDLEILILLTSCICHDLDHPGYNNIYQINAKTELAIRYNDISPLENHHCSIAFRILENEDCNIFKSFKSEDYKTVREGIIRSILATDMARHNEILTNFREITPNFDYNDKAHVNLLCMVLIKVSDISNEARPMDVAEPWLDKLLQEFFKQSDAEKLEGLPVTPFMDREKITKPSSQCSFIGFVLLPLFEALGELLTELQDLIVQPVREALEYYRRLNEATREERLHRKSIVSELTEQHTPSTQSPDSTATVPKSLSNASVKLKKSLSFQQNRSRSRSTDEDTEQSFGSGNIIGEEQSLEDVVEDPESGDSETATEVEVSEKALKFKISTESTVGTGRKSYPGSRKGSRERVQHFNSSDLAKMIQKGKLRSAGFSFDQHCMVGNKKLSFDTPEFLDEYALTMKRRFTEGFGDQSDGEEEKMSKEGECVISKETLNLNKRNSEHLVKIPSNLEEKKSILKCSDNKPFTNAEKLKMNNVKSSTQDDDSGEKMITVNNRKNSIQNMSRVNNTSDNINSIALEKDEIKKVQASESPSCETKNSRSIFSRFRQFTDRFGLSVDKDSKVKHSKNNNSTRNPFPHKSKSNKKLESPCCRSLEEVGERKASTLPKTKNKKAWKFLVLGKDKDKLEGWASDAAVDKLAAATSDTDNQSLPSTSQLQSNCASPKTTFEKLEIVSMKEFKVEVPASGLGEAKREEKLLVEKGRESSLI
jgi:hypothetical protein